MSLSASVEGVDRLVATLQDAGHQLERITPPGGEELVSAALPRTPRRTGLLAGTVRAFVADQELVLTAGGGPVDYAAIVHANQPWLADTIRDQADRITDQVVDQVIDITDTIRGA